MRPTDNSRILRAGHLLLVLMLALAFPQRPLYYSNQNTYFLHGLAAAGVGHLDRDWLANTTDPFPVFSALVAATLQFAGEHVFYIYQIIIQCLYVYGLWGIASHIFKFGNHTAKHLGFLILLGIIHTNSLDDALTEGVANQYVLGPMFQPSVFGVFLILSVYAFLRDRCFTAIACLAVASIFHSSYLLTSAVLTCVYMALTGRSESYRKALALGATALILVSPAVIYGYLNFSPSNSSAFLQAQDILVNYRIPHHALIEQWLDATVILKVALIALALYMVRHTKLFAILAAGFAVSLVLTAIQALTRNHSLALLFPWRISALLVPIASAIILAGSVSLTCRSITNAIAKFARPLRIILMVLVTGLTGWSLHNTYTLFQQNRADQNATAAVAASLYRNGDLYLIPPRLQSFRIAAGVPILVDYKSHPYKDVELIEWFRRVQIASRFYDADSKMACITLQEIVKNYGVTHVVSEASTIDCPLLTPVHRDAVFSIYRIRTQAWPATTHAPDRPDELR